MTPEQFCYWLQGFGELSAEPPTPEQWKSINEHLAEVFHKVTPQVKQMSGAYAGWPPGTMPGTFTQYTETAVVRPGLPGVLTC